MVRCGEPAHQLSLLSIAAVIDFKLAHAGPVSDASLNELVSHGLIYPVPNDVEEQISAPALPQEVVGTGPAN